MVDYFGLGPACATTTKGDHRAPCGLSGLRYMAVLGNYCGHRRAQGPARARDVTMRYRWSGGRFGHMRHTGSPGCGHSIL
ncbi:MAG: hypothetical protein GDA36_08325 [Rhodobacteraceae bacterium]|nr:hypothetical protein [Paracoccaceae bacterium]